MKALAPPVNLSGLKNEMDRLFERLWDGDYAPVTIGEWMPALDLSESNESLVVAVDVPGFEPKDIHVTLREGMLTIRGEKKLELERKDDKFYRSERTQGSFTRIVRLPLPVDGTKVQANFRNGVLTIALPKVAEAKGTDIPVKVA